MIFLGKMLKKLNIKFNEQQLKQYLPKKSLKENLQFIKNGYNTKD
jgi:nitrogen fixation protein